MKKLIKAIATITAACLVSSAYADQVLIIDAQYSTVTQNVQGRLEAAGHTVTVTTDTSTVPTATGTYQQVWDLRYSAALTSTETTAYTSFVTAGGFVYFVTENPGCCMSRNNSVAQLVTDLGGGSTQIGPGWANNVETNVNTTYMTSGITVNYLAVAAIVNSQGIPLISDGSNNVSGMSWIGRAGALNSGVLGTIVTVADTNWLAQAWGTDNQTALDDIIRGIVAGTVGGTISAQGNGAAASNGAAQQQQQNPPQPTTFDHTDANQVVSSATMAAGTFTGNGGALQAVNGSATIANDIALTANGMVLDSNGQDVNMTGTVSGVGGLTFTNTSTGGGTTLNGTYTYTGPTNINNTATVVNNSNISSSSLLTNLGTFTNSATGTVGTWVNDGGVLNNAGVMGNGINRATVNNTGTVGTVQNAEQFNNTGTTGAINNSGTFTNNVGGTVSELAYNNNIVNNNGTITSVTYNGGTVNNNGTIGSINNSEAHGTFNNAGTVSGTVTTNSTVNNSGTVVGLYTNSGALTNTGTTGDWYNTATVNNSGTMGNGTNTGTFTNTGAVGTVVNTGTFANTGTLTSMNNSGTFATTPVTLSSYTQSATGSTVLDYGSRLTVAGPASLDGNLTLIGTPYTLGKYTVLTGAPVTGTYSSYNGVGVLRYTSEGVQVWVMPDGSVVQAQVNNQANNLSGMSALANSSIASAVGSDCGSFGETGSCISINYGASKVGSGDLNSTGITAVKSIDPNWRVGVFANQQLNDAQVGNTKYTSNSPAIGALVGWSESADNIGLGVTVSAVKGTGNYVIGTDKTGVEGQAVQAKVSYSKPLDLDTTVTPYAGIRYSEFKVNGYTENGPIFPLTYGSVNQTATDLLAGVTVAHRITDSLTATVNAGVVQNLAYDAGKVTATSDMGNYSAPLQGSHYTSAAFGAGLSYEVAKGQRVGVNAGWQQKSLTNSNITSYGVSYTVGF